MLVDIFGKELNTLKELVGDSEFVEGVHEFFEGDFVVFNDLGPSLLRSIIKGDLVCTGDSIDDWGFMGHKGAYCQGDAKDE